MRSLIGGSGKGAVSSPKRQNFHWGPSSLLFNGVLGIPSWGYSSRDAKFTARLHLVPAIKSGTVLSLRAFMANKGTAFPLSTII